MAHTFNDETVLMISNGDFSGDMTIKWPKSERETMTAILNKGVDIGKFVHEVKVPGKVLFRVLRHMLSRKLESAMENFRARLWDELENP